MQRLITGINFLYLIFSLFSDAKALGPPELRCTSVNSSGAVTLSWIVPPDPAMTFNSYHIFTSTNAGGPFTEIDSVFSYAQSSYTHVNANAGISTVYYYITTRDNSNSYSGSSDTLKTIYLNVTKLGGIALLSWNEPHVPKLSSASFLYKIYREYPLGTWVLFDSTGSTIYRDTIAVCGPGGTDVSINYRIELEDAAPCNSVSNIDGDLFKDLTLPAPPILDSVSVDPNSGLAELGWRPSPSQDTYGYKIFRNLTPTGGFPEVGSVTGINTTNFTYTSSSASSGIEYFKITAIDGCASQSILTEAQNSIFSSVFFDDCEAKNDLSWNSYNNMSGGLAGYKIFGNINGSSFNLLGTTTNTSFSHVSLITGNEYCYYISAFNNLGTITASSNKICQIVDLHTPPTFSYLRTATVTSSNKIDISAFTDNNADVKFYKVLRATTPGIFSQIGSVPYTVGFGDIAFTDAFASPDESPYYYKIVAVDDCGNDMLPETNIAKTIYLTAASEGFSSNELTWNDYEGWAGSISSYNIYRGVDGVFNPVPIANVPFTGTNVYVDDITGITANEKISYYIEAMEGSGNPFSFNEKSRSNTAEVLLQSSVYIPNAFSPLGLNKVFKPVSAFIERSDYNFMIFNRWGEKIFETKDINEGWTGFSGSNECPSGMYVYFLKYKIPGGEAFERKGSVMLIR